MFSAANTPLQPPSINFLVKQSSRFIYWLLRPWFRHRVAHVRIERVEDLSLVIHPHVLNPVVFRSGAWFAKLLNERTIPMIAEVIKPVAKHQDSVRCLDLGCGSGVCALIAARMGYQVTAVDINPMAVRCSNINASLNQLEDRIEILNSDLFNGLDQRRFDLILFNPPFFRGKPKPGFDQAWRSDDVFERFAEELKLHLTDQGYALLLLSTEGSSAILLQLLQQLHYRVSELKRRHFGTEIMSLYKVSLEHVL